MKKIALILVMSNISMVHAMDFNPAQQKQNNVPLGISTATQRILCCQFSCSVPPCEKCYRHIVEKQSAIQTQKKLSGPQKIRRLP